MAYHFWKRIILLTFGLSFCFATLTDDVGAITFESKERLHISNLHQIDDDLFASGSNITIDGLIGGDIFAFGYETKINGTSAGSQNVFSYEYTLSGKAGGGVHSFSYRANIDGYIARSLLATGGEVRIGKTAIIEKDAVVNAGICQMEGTISGDFNCEAERVFISGIINGIADVKANELVFIPPAVISGDLNYEVPHEIDFDTLTGVTIMGETIWKKPQPQKDDESNEINAVIEFSQLLAAFLFGLLGIYLFRRYVTESYNQLRERFALSFATGVVASVIGLICLIFLAITLSMVIFGWLIVQGDSPALGAVFLVLSILGLPVFSLASVASGILFYSGKIMFAYLAGSWVRRLFKKDPNALSWSQLCTGLIVVTIFFVMPDIGWVFYLFASITGFGAIVLGMRHVRRLDHANRMAGGNPPPEPPTPPTPPTQPDTADRGPNPPPVRGPGDQ